MNQEMTLCVFYVQHFFTPFETYINAKDVIASRETYINAKDVIASRSQPEPSLGIADVK